MNVSDKNFQTIWPDPTEYSLHIIDQTKITASFCN
jgi:hypothetical protein